MEGFCRGCLIKYDEPMELLQYTEKNRRLFVYSTGLLVKRNDSFTFQLCKDCFLNMKQACKFKKNCRNSDKRFRNYVALKDLGDPVDFCTFLKNSDDTLTFRFPTISGSSTPANQKCRDDDNESTCTSIRNFMTDILQGEEMPDTEARIIKEVIEEEADLLDDSLDSHWLQDDMSIDTDFRLDFSFSPFSTPRTVNNDRCYTPKQKEDQITFDTINTEKQTKILNDFTNAFKSNKNIEELCIFVEDVSAIEKKERIKNLKESSQFGIDDIDGMEKTERDTLNKKKNVKDLVRDLNIDEIDSMVTSDSQTVESNQNFKELCDFGLKEINCNDTTENNALETSEHFKELSNFGIDDVDGIEYAESNAVKSNNSFKELISNMDIEEIDSNGKSETKAVKSTQNQKELISHFGLGAFGKPDSNNLKINKNLKELCDFSLDGFNAEEKAGSKTHKNVKSLKELCDFSLDSIGSFERPASNINKNNESLKELYELSLNSFDDTAKSGSNTFKADQNVKELDLSLTEFNDIANSGSNTFKSDANVKEACDFSIDDINGTEKSESNLDLPSLPDVPPDFYIPKGVNGSIQSNNDISNSSINIEAFLKDKPCTIDTNLEDALKNTDSQEFSLEDILVSPRVFPAESAASTPTITNILFGEKLDTIDTNTKIEHYTVCPTESAASTPTIRNILFGGKLDTPDTNTKIERCIVYPAESAASTPTIRNILFGEQLDTPDINTKIEECIVYPVESAASTPTIRSILFGGKLDTPDTNTKIEQCIVYPAESAASTPTITNILFGGKLDTTDTNTKMEQSIVFPAESGASTPSITNLLFGSTDANSKMEQCIEPYHDIQGDIEIFEEFFQNDTKEFDLEDIIRENGGLKLGDWKKPIAVNDVEVNNKENESKNIDMDISIDDTESKNDDLIYISHASPNDKFNMQYLYCKLCKIRYDTSRALSVHLTKFHKIKIVKPKARNSNKTKSKDEVITNISEIPFDDRFDMKNSYCKLCEKKYDTSRALCVHFSKTHKIKIEKPKHRKSRGINNTPVTESNNQAIVNIPDTSATDKFDMEKSYCKLCKKKYKGSRALSIHLSVKHNIKISQSVYDRKNRNELLCNNCGIKCGDSSNFARHVKMCQLKGCVFKCEHCLQEFKTKFYLERHKITHTNMKREKATGKEFVCTSCGLVLRGQSNYALHMRRHTKDYSAKCNYCDKGFYRESDLRAHMRRHTGDTPFSCTFCPKLFARRDVLLRHIHTHLGDKLFECDYCGLKCLKKCDLINHIEKKSCRKVKQSKKKKKTGKKVNNMETDIPEEQEEAKEPRKVKKAKKIKKRGKKENMDIDIPEEQEEKVEGRKVKIPKKKVKTDKTENMDIDLTEEQEEKVEAEKQVKVQKEKVTVIYAKGSDATIRKQLPFLKTANIPAEQEEKVEAQNEEVTVLYAKGSDATIRKQLPFLETDISN